MEHSATFVNDLDHAREMLLPLLADHSGPAQWTVVVCTPRLTRHIGRFVNRRGRDAWRAQWADQLRQALEPALHLPASGLSIEWRTADGPLEDITRQLRATHGAGLRVLDARCSRMGAPNPPVVPEQHAMAVGPRLTAPIAITSTLSLVLALSD